MIVLWESTGFLIQSCLLSLLINILCRCRDLVFCRFGILHRGKRANSKATPLHHTIGKGWPQNCVKSKITKLRYSSHFPSYSSDFQKYSNSETEMGKSADITSVNDIFGSPVSAWEEVGKADWCMNCEKS